MQVDGQVCVGAAVGGAAGLGLCSDRDGVADHVAGQFAAAASFCRRRALLLALDSVFLRAVGRRVVVPAGPAACRSVPAFRPARPVARKPASCKAGGRPREANIGLKIVYIRRILF